MARQPQTSKTDKDAPATAEQTRLALIKAALKLFGTAGYDAASTREIAAAANANIGSIAYHFGGKEGLRLAVADYIVEMMQGIAAQVMTAPNPVQGREAARRLLTIMVERAFAFFVSSPQASEIVPFVLREMASPTAAFDRIYSGVFEPVHRRLCLAWEAATGEPAESEAAKLAVFLILGQVVYFRIAQEAVRRRMGWPEIGPAQLAAVTAVAARNLDAAARERTEKSS